jgi:hypothetical protein
MRAGELGGFGGGLGVRMHLAQWKMTKDESELLPESFLQKLNDRMRETAVRTLVVTVLDKGYRRFRRTADVIMRRYWGS